MSEQRLIASLTCDARLQMRERMDESTVERYAEAIRENTDRWPFPPIQTVATFVWDGWHRLEAAKRCGLKEVPVNDHAKDLAPEDNRFEAALVLACGANARHGLQRSASEARKAAITVIRLFPGKSLRQLGEIAHVSHTYIAKLKQEFESEARGVNVYTSEAVVTQASAVSEPSHAEEVDSHDLAVNVYTPNPSALGTNATASKPRAPGPSNAEEVGGKQSPPAASQADAQRSSQLGMMADGDLSDATSRLCPNVEAGQSTSCQNKSKSVSAKPCVPKRPLVDSVTDAMQALGSLNKHLAATKHLNPGRYADCRHAMKIIDENLEQLLEDAKTSELSIARLSNGTN
jgi:hypothetical protein